MCVDTVSMDRVTIVVCLFCFEALRRQRPIVSLRLTIIAERLESVR